MAGSRTPDELTPICRQAQGLAARRKERLSTVHLLLTIASEANVASSLLDAHKLSAARLEQSAKGLVDEEDAAQRALTAARELSARTRAGTAGSHHVLLALLGERRCAAFLLIERCGVDPSRLRMAAMQIAVGATSPRRLSLPAPAPDAPPARSAPRASRSGTAIAVSVAPRPRVLREEVAGPASPQAQPSPSSPPPPMAPPPVPPSPTTADAPLPPARGAEPQAGLAPSAVPVHRAPARATEPPPPAAGEVRAASGRGRAEAGPTLEDRFGLPAERFPLLTLLGKNMTLASARGEDAPVIGRHEEIDRCLDVLAKRHANNPVLLGMPGVGKTSTLRGIAAATASASPGSSDDRILVELTAASLLSGTGVRGALAERLATIRREAGLSGGRVVLVFDDIHQLFGGDIDDEIGGELRAQLTRGELTCMGTSAPEDYRRVIEQDASLSRCFTPVLLDEPSPDDAVLILKSAEKGFAAHHRVRFLEASLGAAVEWTQRYMPGRALPDKALSVLDLAGARARRRGLGEVGPEVVAGVVAEMTDVPAERMLETDGARMLALEALFAESVVGHGPHLSRIAALLRRNAAGIRGRRPIGTFLLLGPTGVGKTETAKAIAKALFHSGDAMTRLDLSEFAEAHAIARLIGAPPGYVGYEAGGQLTEAVRRRPYQVVLLDEIEKAHRDVLEAFLQVFDEGRLTDGRGRTVDFTNTVIVLTSNLGAASLSAGPERSIGFLRGPGPGPGASFEEPVIAAAREALPPELYNRLDEVLAFAPLGRPEVREIARRLLAGLSASLEASRGVALEVEEATYEALVRQGGYDPELGARPMKRAIGKLVEGPLAELILRGKLQDGEVALVRVDAAGAIVVEKRSHGQAKRTPLGGRAASG